MTIRKISTSTASYTSSVDAVIDDKKLNSVKGIAGEAINQNIDKQSDQNMLNQQRDRVDDALENALKRTKFCIFLSKEPLSDKIRSFVKAYNQLVYLIVKKEKKHERQYDQYIQHYIMSHHIDFLALGISVNHAIYLEFNMIEIRNAIDDIGTSKINKLYFTKDGIFDQLIQSTETTIDKLLNDVKQLGNIGRRFDIKA